MRLLPNLRYRLLLISLISLLISCTEQNQPPNIILIFVDDLGYGDLSCYGSNRIQTPNLDKMAEEGIRFTDFHVAAAICTPSRAALLTGKYPQRVGLPSVLFPNNMKRGQRDGKAYGLNTEETTMAEMLGNAGYKTAAIGKWHLGDLPVFMPNNHGFDKYYGIPYSHDMIPENNRRYNFGDLPLYDNGEILQVNPPLDQLTSIFTEKSIEFIEESGNNPFFLYLAHPMPHRPLHASSKFMERYTDEELSSIDGIYNGRDFIYPATVEELDHSTGQILSTLERLDLEENTLIIFTSDNGPAIGSSGGFRGGKGSMFEGGMRVPFIARWPGKIPPGTTSGELITALDLLPTFGHLAGADIPDDIDGVQVWETFLNEKKSLRDQFFHINQNNGVVAVRSGKWKLFHKQNRLFNLEEDPFEKVNLYDTQPLLSDSLRKVIENFQIELEANSSPPGFAKISDQSIPDK